MGSLCVGNKVFAFLHISVGCNRTHVCITVLDNLYGCSCSIFKRLWESLQGLKSLGKCVCMATGAEV